MNFNFTTRSPTYLLFGECIDNVSSLAISLDGQFLVSGGYDNAVILWHLSNKNKIGKSLDNSKDLVFSQSNFVEFSPGGELVINGSVSNSLRYIDSFSGQLIRDSFLVGDSIKSVSSVLFSPNGEFLAISSFTDNKIHFVDSDTGIQIMSSIDGHDSRISSLDLNSDGSVLVSSTGTTIRFWDVSSGMQIGDPILGEHVDGINVVAFSPDDQVIASKSWDGIIRLWDIATSQIVWEIYTEFNFGRDDLLFSPDGKFLISGDIDGNIMFLDSMSGKQLRKSLEGHPWQITSLAISQDGKYLASGSCSRMAPLFGCIESEIRLWDIFSGQQIGKELILHESEIIDLAISPNGEILASAGMDSFVWLFNFNKNSLIVDACNMITRNLSKDEWHTHFPGECYRQTCSQFPPEYKDDRLVCRVQERLDNLFIKEYWKKVFSENKY